jgi:hypothetical protein
MPSPESTYRPEFEFDLAWVSKDIPSAVYEYGHLLDSEPTMSLILHSDLEEDLGLRYPQDEFEFGKYSSIGNN